MRAKKVDQNTAQRVTEYYHHGRSTSFKEIIAASTLPSLPLELSAELHSQLYRSIIQQCTIFDTTKFPFLVVLDFLHQLEPVIGVPLQLIVQERAAQTNRAQSLSNHSHPFLNLTPTLTHTSTSTCTLPFPRRRADPTPTSS